MDRRVHFQISAYPNFLGPHLFFDFQVWRQGQVTRLGNIGLVLRNLSMALENLDRQIGARICSCGVNRRLERRVAKSRRESRFAIFPHSKAESSCIYFSFKSQFFTNTLRRAFKYSLMLFKFKHILQFYEKTDDRSRIIAHFVGISHNFSTHLLFETLIWSQSSLSGRHPSRQAIVLVLQIRQLDRSVFQADTKTDRKSFSF